MTLSTPPTSAGEGKKEKQGNKDPAGKKADLIEVEPLHQDLARLLPIGNLHLVINACALSSFVLCELDAVLAQESGADEPLFYLAIETAFTTVENQRRERVGGRGEIRMPQENDMKNIQLVAWGK